MNWTPPTYADAARVSPNLTVGCPNCRRRVPAGMLYDLRAVPTDSLTTLKDATGFACDACRETLFREQRLTKEDYARFCDAPDETLVKMRQADGLSGLKA